jgi:hypothetical protein
MLGCAKRQVNEEDSRQVSINAVEELAQNLHSKDRPNPLTLNNLARRSARLLKPSLKIAHSDFVIDTNVCDRDVHNVHPSWYTRDPFVSSEGSNCVSHGLK